MVFLKLLFWRTETEGNHKHFSQCNYIGFQTANLGKMVRHVTDVLTFSISSYGLHSHLSHACVI
jgi:hypothetical protein